MLAELVLNALVRCAAPARRLGYGRGAVSLWSRSRRCARAWAPHHAATRDYVAGLLRDLPQKGGNAWVLGAGLLDDLPLDDLCRRFDRVILADIAFLPGMARRLRHYGNAEMRLFDATGIVAPLSRWQPAENLPLPAANALAGLDAAAPSLVLSLNLLSQLPLLPLAWLERQGVDHGTRQDYGRRIVNAHLAGLRGLACPVGLVSDFRRIFRNRAGEAVVAESALFDVTPPVAEREWSWALAPLGEIDGQTALDLRVLATRNLGRAA